MLRWTSLDAIPEDFGPSVVTLGNFDGVHRGHRAVLAEVVGKARNLGIKAVAVTFDPHPVAVLHPERAPAEVTGLAHRLDLIEGTGIDAVVVLPFTREFAQLTPADFVRQVFVDALHAHTVVVGQDTRFGVHNSGTIETLRELAVQWEFEVEALAPVGESSHAPTTTRQSPDAEAGAAPDPAARTWSSSHVRHLLAQGDVAQAADILGRPHRVSGMVVHGHHRGRELGYPTANVGLPRAGMPPADGVYAGWLERLDLPDEHPDRRMAAAISVGTNPTFDDVPERSVEAYVLDRLDLDLYDQQVAIDFVAHLRGNIRFDSIEELMEQMARDVSLCRGLLGR